MFVAALNFASDFGVLADKPKQIKMQCFPGDNIDIEPLIDELVAHGFWQRRIAPDGANALVIRTFNDHQRVDKPSQGRWGDPREWPKFPDGSPNDPGAVEDRSLRKGMEGKGESAAKPPRTPRDPKWNSLWDALCAHFGKPTTAPERSNRARQVRELVAIDATAGDIDARVREHKRRRPGWTLTANSIVTHWTDLTPRATPARMMNGAVLDDRVAI